LRYTAARAAQVFYNIFFILFSLNAYYTNSELAQVPNRREEPAPNFHLDRHAGGGRLRCPAGQLRPAERQQQDVQQVSRSASKGGSTSGLPDGLFSNQNPNLGKVWNALGWKMFIYIFYGHL
jgi:hypothetical protein